jgi:hypothetical protein
VVPVATGWQSRSVAAWEGSLQGSTTPPKKPFSQSSKTQKLVVLKNPLVPNLEQPEFNPEPVKPTDWNIVAPPKIIASQVSQRHLRRFMA